MYRLLLFATLLYNKFIMKYFYNARNNNNEVVQGNITASSIADAATELERKGYTVLSIKEAEPISDSGISSFEYSSKITEFTIQEKKEFFNSFYHLYNSGVSVLETFKLIIQSSSNSNIKNFCRLIIKKTEKGKSLKDALRNHTGYLGMAYTMLIAAGEEAGKLPETIEGILKNIQKQEEIRSNIISALTYPAAICSLALIVGMLFKFFIIKVFEQIGCSGNICMKMLIISAIIKMAIVIGILIGIGIYIYKNKELTAKIRGFFANTFLFKNLVNNYYFTNYFYVMSLAYEAGVPITEAIVMSNSVVNIPSYKNKLKKAAEMVLNGCETATALATTSLFSGYAISQVSAGEKAGELDKAFRTVAFDYEEKTNTAIKVLLKLLEPLVMVIVGIIVAYIAIKGYSSYYNGLMNMF